MFISRVLFNNFEAKLWQKKISQKFRKIGKKISWFLFFFFRNIFSIFWKNYSIFFFKFFCRQVDSFRPLMFWVYWVWIWRIPPNSFGVACPPKLSHETPRIPRKGQHIPQLPRPDSTINMNIGHMRPRLAHAVRFWLNYLWWQYYCLSWIQGRSQNLYRA